MNTTVIITGASSGIGKATALYLAHTGCRVYAGVRKESDKNQLLKESTGELIEYFDREVKNIPGIEALEVARVISRAILDERPKIRYLVGPGARKMKVLSRFPAKTRDKMLYKAIHR